MVLLIGRWTDNYADTDDAAYAVADADADNATGADVTADEQMKRWEDANAAAVAAAADDDNDEDDDTDAADADHADDEYAEDADVDIVTLAVSPGVTHFGAYHRCSDGQF